MVNTYVRSASRLKFDSDSARIKLEGWHGGEKRQKQGGYGAIFAVKKTAKKREPAKPKWQCRDTRQPGMDVLRLNTRQSEIFERFRRKDILTF